MKNNIILITVYLSLISCSGFNDAAKVLRNEKIKTTDEFLVKKREPLVLPPNYEEMPKPGSADNNDRKDEERIKKILKAPERINETRNNNTTIEKSIIERLKK